MQASKLAKLQQVQSQNSKQKQNQKLIQDFKDRIKAEICAVKAEVC
jgi:hypothetical protein